MEGTSPLVGNISNVLNKKGVQIRRGGEVVFVSCLGGGDPSAGWPGSNWPPPTVQAAGACLARGAFWPAPRINVLLCHRRGYDLCNAAERVGSLKPNTRSISGRNVLAAARCLDTPETKIKKIKIKKGLSGFVTGGNT